MARPAKTTAAENPESVIRVKAQRILGEQESKQQKECATARLMGGKILVVVV
jgi:hypothetical protein